MVLVLKDLKTIKARKVLSLKQWKYAMATPIKIVTTIGASNFFST